MNMHFVENVKRPIAEKSLSQRELAERIDVPRNMVGRWENGNRMPDALMIFRLSRCLGVDTGKLLSIASENRESPGVILMDERVIIHTGSFPFWNRRCKMSRSRAYPAIGGHRIREGQSGHAGLSGN